MYWTRYYISYLKMGYLEGGLDKLDVVVDIVVDPVVLTVVVVVVLDIVAFGVVDTNTPT